MNDERPREVRAAAARQVSREAAETARTIAATDPLGARYWWTRADRKDLESVELMKAEGDVVAAICGEVVLATDVDRRDLIDRDPDSLDVGASRERLSLLGDAEATTLGLDMARSLEARDAGEIALAHQMAAAHSVAMKLMQHANRLANGLTLTHRDPNYLDKTALTAGRLVNSATRLMGSYQDALSTLHQKRRGGKQTVVVQHVHVTDGGQAVVNGALDRGTGRGEDG